MTNNNQQLLFYTNKYYNQRNPNNSEVITLRIVLNKMPNLHIIHMVTMIFEV